MPGKHNKPMKMHNKPMDGHGKKPMDGHGKKPMDGHSKKPSMHHKKPKMMAPKLKTGVGLHGPFKMKPGSHSQVNPGNFKGSEVAKYSAMAMHPMKYHDNPASAGLKKLAAANPDKLKYIGPEKYGPEKYHGPNMYDKPMFFGGGMPSENYRSTGNVFTDKAEEADKKSEKASADRSDAQSKLDSARDTRRKNRQAKRDANKARRKTRRANRIISKQ